VRAPQLCLIRSAPGRGSSAWLLSGSRASTERVSSGAAERIRQNRVERAGLPYSPKVPIETLGGASQVSLCLPISER